MDDQTMADRIMAAVDWYAGLRDSGMFPTKEEKARDALAALVAEACWRAERVCRWTWNDDGYYVTECDAAIGDDEAPADWYRFCMRCGGRVEVADGGQGVGNG